MTLLLFKLFATPLIVGIAGWVSRRWGTAAGGWVAGLPVTTGPISVFLFVEYGADFSIQAALGTLYAMPAIAATAAGYRMAVNFGCGWVSSQATAQGCYLAMAFFLAHFNPDPLLIFLLSMGPIIAGLGLAGSSSRSPLPAFSSNTVLVLRMAVTTALVLVITVLAPMLGPMLSGLLGTVLIVAGVLAAAGPPRAWQRGRARGDARHDARADCVFGVLFCCLEFVTAAGFCHLPVGIGRGWTGWCRC